MSLELELIEKIEKLASFDSYNEHYLDELYQELDKITELIKAFRIQKDKT